MFSERLERLIEAALQDGMLSDQEKAAIIKRAQAEGEDIDEVDIYIQSLQQKRQQELSEKAKKATTEEMIAEKKAREAKEEEIQAHEKLRKGNVCPHCDEPIPPLTRICPNCGKAINANETAADKELEDFIDKITKATVRVKAGHIGDYKRNKAELEALIQKANLFYSDNVKVKTLIVELKVEINKADKKAASTKRWDIVKKNKWIVFVIAALAICAALFGIKKAYWYIDPTMNGKACLEKVNSAMEAGDLEEAKVILDNYDAEEYKWSDNYDPNHSMYVEARNKVCEELIAKGLYEQVLAVDGDYRPKIVTACIKKQDWENALKYVDSYHSSEENRVTIAKHYMELEDYEKAFEAYEECLEEDMYKGLVNCVTYMISHGKVGDAKVFVEAHLGGFESTAKKKKYDRKDFTYSQENVRTRMLKLIEELGSK